MKIPSPGMAHKYKGLLHLFIFVIFITDFNDNLKHSLQVRFIDFIPMHFFFNKLLHTLSVLPLLLHGT